MNEAGNSPNSSAEAVPNFRPVRIGVSRRHGHVYFVTDGQLIKIGHSLFPKWRKYNLRSPNKLPLVMLAHFPGFMDEEHNVHRLFHELNASANGRGEWFRKHRRITAFIAKLEKHRPYLTQRVISINDVIFDQHKKIIKDWHAEGRMLRH